MANFRYSHLYTTKTGSSAITAAESALKQAEIGLAIAKDEEKILFKNERGEVISISSDAQTESKIEELETALNNEVSRATSAETAEAVEREAADTELLNAISGEVQNRIADVDAEEARAISAETVLGNLVDSVDDKVDQEVAERKAEAVASVDYDSSGKTIDFYNANGTKIDSIDATDFIKDGMIESVRLETTGGTTYLVIVWNTDAGKETTRIDIGDIFDADNYYTKAETDDLLDNKTDYQVNGTNGKSLMFNEADGGGAKFEHNDGTWSFAGVNDGGKNGLAGQIYAVEPSNGYKGTKLDVTVGGLYYTKGEESGKPVAQRDVEANEVATKGNVANAKVSAVNVDANAGITLTFADGSTLTATEAEEITLSAGEF